MYGKISRLDHQEDVEEEVVDSSYYNLAVVHIEWICLLAQWDAKDTMVDHEVRCYNTLGECIPGD